MDQKKATASVLASGILWGLISIFVRALSAAGLGSLQITTVRMVVGAAGMLLVLLAMGNVTFFLLDRLLGLQRLQRRAR